MNEAMFLAQMGSKVKAARIKAKLSQQKLANLCGVDDSSISQIESGNFGSKVTTLKKLADALNKEVKDFV